MRSIAIIINIYKRKYNTSCISFKQQLHQFDGVIP